MKTLNKRPRKLMRTRNRERINRARNQQAKQVPALILLFLIKLGINGLNPAQLLARLQLHIQMLTGNLFFPVINPTLLQMTAKANDLSDTLIEIEAGNKALIPHRETLVKEIGTMIRQLSYDIQEQSEGDEEKILSSGFEVRTFGGAPQMPGQVTELTSKPVGPGKIKLTWKKLENVSIYIVERSANPSMFPASWETIGKTRNVSFLVEELNPGQLYYFREYATIRLEDGNPSDPVEQRSL